MPVAAAAGMCYHGIVSQDTQQAKVHMGGETMKKIVILGAGKIGRGFVADAFAAGGYKLVFADADAALALLREGGEPGAYILGEIVPGKGGVELW